MSQNGPVGLSERYIMPGSFGPPHTMNAIENMNVSDEQKLVFAMTTITGSDSGEWKLSKSQIACNGLSPQNQLLLVRSLSPASDALCALKYTQFTTPPMPTPAKKACVSSRLFTSAGVSYTLCIAAYIEQSREGSKNCLKSFTGAMKLTTTVFVKIPGVA